MPFSVYSLLHYTSDHDELDYRDQESLPTTKLFEPLHEAMVSREYYDRTTGEVIPDYDPRTSTFSVARKSQISYNDTPERRLFVFMGHAIAAAILGIAGGVFALQVRDGETRG